MVPGDKDVCPYPVPLSHFTSQDFPLLGAPQAGTPCGFILCHWYLGTGRCEIKACWVRKTNLQQRLVSPQGLSTPSWWGSRCGSHRTR